MRKIIPRHIEERNSKRKQIVIGVTLMALMLLSTIAYAFQMLFNNSKESAENTVNYKGFNFVQKNSFWVLSTNIGNFIFSYNPNDTKKTEGRIDNLPSYNGTKLYIYSESPEAESEVRVNMGQIASSIESACPPGKKCDENIPVKTCDDRFIIISEGSEKISQEKNCVFIQGNKADLLSLTDSFLLKILGIDS